MTIHILTDSSHYLPPATVAELNLHVLPLSLNVGGRQYQERLEVTTENLFEMLTDQSVDWPTTSAVTPGAVQAAFDELTANPEDEVVGVFMSRGTSATVEVALNVAQSHPAWDRIHVVDSLAISAPLALTLQIVGQLVKEGADASGADLLPAAVADVARRVGEQMRVFFTLDTLEYLHRGGRMRNSQALLGSLLSIKPVLWLNEGRIELWKRARGKRRAFSIIVEEAVDAMPPGEPVYAIIGDTRAPEDKAALKQALQDNLPVAEIYDVEIGPVVAAHVGPGCVTIAVVPVSATRPVE